MLGTGQELVEPGQIRECAVGFFMSLYTSEYHESEALLRSSVGSGLRSVRSPAHGWTSSTLTFTEPSGTLWPTTCWRCSLKAWPQGPWDCPPGGQLLLFCPKRVTWRTCGSGAHSGRSRTGPNGLRGHGSLLGTRSVQAADGGDPFPEIKLAAHLGDRDGPLLRPAQPSILETL